jgi:hypothetical protein
MTLPLTVLLLAQAAATPAAPGQAGVVLTEQELAAVATTLRRTLPGVSLAGMTGVEVRPDRVTLRFDEQPAPTGVASPWFSEAPGVIAPELIGALYFGDGAAPGPLGLGGRLEEWGRLPGRTWTVALTAGDTGATLSGSPGVNGAAAGHDPGGVSALLATEPAGTFERRTHAARAGCGQRVQMGGRQADLWYGVSGVRPVRRVLSMGERGVFTVHSDTRLHVLVDGERVRSVERTGDVDRTQEQVGDTVTSSSGLQSRAVHRRGRLVRTLSTSGDPRATYTWDARGDWQETLDDIRLVRHYDSEGRVSQVEEWYGENRMRVSVYSTAERVLVERHEMTHYSHDKPPDLVPTHALHSWSCPPR